MPLRAELVERPVIHARAFDTSAAYSCLLPAPDGQRLIKHR